MQLNAPDPRDSFQQKDCYWSTDYNLLYWLDVLKPLIKSKQVIIRKIEEEWARKQRPSLRKVIKGKRIIFRGGGGESPPGASFDSSKLNTHYIGKDPSLSA